MFEVRLYRLVAHQTDRTETMTKTFCDVCERELPTSVGGFLIVTINYSYTTGGFEQKEVCRECAGDYSLERLAEMLSRK